MNPQEAKLTDEMREAMPDGATVCYLPGMTYPADRLPTIIVRRGVADARTYTWVVCDDCGESAWCSTHVGVFGECEPTNACARSPGIHRAPCDEHADMAALAVAIIENVDALIIPNL